MNSTFVPLHLLSNYSLLYGANHIQELVKHASSLGIKSIALTDRNNLYGLHTFLRECKNHHIQPIIGARLESHGERMICLARNPAGFAMLSHAITVIHRDPPPLPELLSLLDGNTIIIIDHTDLLRRVAHLTALRDNPP
ncbi:PHP domain-containing protein, partial [Myxococcota bacterium]|nr:PHP domain-containing protein [Myxococcota bacterium]